MTPRCNRSAPGHRRDQRGFTLLELIVVLFIVIVLAALAAPSLREMNVRSIVKANTNDLVTALNLARAEAVKRGSDVAVVAQGGDWNNGWAIQTVGVVETLVTHDAIQPDFRVMGAATGGGANDRVVFTATGALRLATGYDFNVCRPSYSPGEAESRRIIVSATGSVRSRRDTTSSPAGNCS
ncbi:MAG: GspH/FimT family pseudopilin [Lysobacterales bacterium]|nr:GspH/FimT family pseudopilin [Xanthomonadales bacterium]MCB1611786.1 GspH/FimT family pseudopilin [Xanthomonadales bacterium]MCP5474686.1 GspH/FimT family pseudopilin [Rhodanobacteraceae bacterium]